MPPPAAPEPAAATPVTAPGPAAPSGPAAAAARPKEARLRGVVGLSGWEVNADKDGKRGVREYVYIQESRTAGQLESQHGQNQWIKPGKHSGQWKKLAAAPGTPVTDIETRQLKAMMNMEHKQLQEAAAEVNATVLAQNPDSMALSLRFFCL